MASGRRTERTSTKGKFARVVEALSQDRGVTVGGGKGFGSGALKIAGKIFAMISSNNHFVVKLSKDRVNAIVASGAGKRFEPRPGKPMKEWLVVTGKGSDWIRLAKEAREFVNRPSLIRKKMSGLAHFNRS